MSHTLRQVMFYGVDVKGSGMSDVGRREASTDGTSSLPPSPVRSGNVFEETMEALLQGIRLGQWQPGEKLLPERELAEALRVSRTTLREVLGDLSKNGYVTVRRGRYGGTYVAQPLPLPLPPISSSAITELGWAGVSDLLTLRRVVEPAAAELAAQRVITEAEERRLWDAHRECVAASAPQYRPLDSRLHLVIAELSGSTRLRAVVVEARAGINALLDCMPLLPPNLLHSAQQHDAIVAAILASEPEAARQAMTDHLDGTAALLHGFLG